VYAPVQSRGADLVVVAASQGGLRAFGELLEHLPGDFPAPLVFHQHRTPQPNVLALLLRRHTTLRVVDADEGTSPLPGHCYVADPVRQLLLDEDGRFAYDVAESGRPRADVLLDSASRVHGARLIAVIMTGRLDDGAVGAIAVKERGGRVIAQDRSADANAMPAASIATGCVDFVLPLPTIAAALTTLTMLPSAGDLFRVTRPPWSAAREIGA
jgi:two-component system chemotaxis response regulator CheB